MSPLCYDRLLHLSGPVHHFLRPFQRLILCRLENGRIYYDATVLARRGVKVVELVLGELILKKVHD